MTRRSVGRLVVGVLLVLLSAAGLVALVFPEVVETLLHGESRQLREQEAPAGIADPRRQKLLVLAIDGVDRDLLYDMLRAGELPGLAHLLGGRQGHELPHAHLDTRVLSTMPSS